MNTYRVSLTALSFSLIFAAGCTSPHAIPRSEPTPKRTVAEDAPQAPRWASRLSGICDASAAVLRDNGELVVASDEYNFLTRFDPKSGTKLGVLEPSLEELLDRAGFDLQIDGDTNRPREIDVEGVAMLHQDGEPVTLWIGSHGRRKAKWGPEDDEPRSPKLRRNRRVLLGTRFLEEAGALALVGSPVASLPDVLSNPPESLAAKLAPLATAEPRWANSGGWNIEGLAADPDGGLLLGFRSPVDEDGLALVLRTANPLQATGGAEIRLDAAEWLDLGTRGIRSMDWSPDHRSWFLVAGPVDNVDISDRELPQRPGYAVDFAVYRWAGFGHSPTKLEVDLTDLRPEILVMTKRGFYLISDDGKEPRLDGKECGEILKTFPEHPGVYSRAQFFPLEATAE